jgi:hypothetical protein
MWIRMVFLFGSTGFENSGPHTCYTGVLPAPIGILTNTSEGRWKSQLCKTKEGRERKRIESRTELLMLLNLKLIQN